MKNIFTYIFAVSVLFLTAGCTNFLDRNPNMGLEESAIYKDYNSITNYLDNCFLELEEYFQRDHMMNGPNHNSQMSDECATTDNQTKVQIINSGNWMTQKREEVYELGVTGVSVNGRAYRALRVANRVIANIGKVPNLTTEQKNNVLGQAHFFRAWFYFNLMKRYGGMPKLDRVIESGLDNTPRLSYQDSHDWMMEDIEKAVAMLPDNWDDVNVGRPNKIAAMALRGMTELYAASPLMQNGIEETVVMEYNRERAAQAAKYIQQTIDYVNSSVTTNRLVSGEEYENIFYWATPPFNHPEHLWYNRRNRVNQLEQIRSFCLCPQNAGVSGHWAVSCNMPTLNITEMFERKGGDGIYYPTTDPRSGYSLAGKPFDNRDPRFYNNMLVPGEKFGKRRDGTDYVVSLYVNGYDYNDFKTNRLASARQISGFMHKKFHWPEANQWTAQYELYRFGTSVYIRAAQLYLDFAEASFEATGSATARVEGCTLNAEEALNIIRNRVGVTDVPSDIVGDAGKFREAYRRERAVELFLENHRWWDIRRWMIAHELFREANPIKGLVATLVNPSDNNNQDVDYGRKDANLKYESYDMTAELRNFQMRNYWYPFPSVDVYSLSELKQNPGW